MLRIVAVPLVCLIGFGVTTMARAHPLVRASAGPMRSVLVVPQGRRVAPRSLGTRDCIAYPRSCVNGVGGIEVVYAVKGAPPRRMQVGTVLTDTNCQADSYGVSHCLNVIRLGRRTLLVRHDHSMMNDPCLAPGERVRVRAV